MKKFVLIIALLVVYIPSLMAQDGIPIECGKVVEGEFTGKQHQITFIISDVNLGDRIQVSGEVFGELIQFRSVIMFSPSGSRVISYEPYERDFSYDSGVLGEAGSYELRVSNGSAGGTYAIQIGCILQDGTVIEPGDVVSQANAPKNFSGYGFSQVGPVDFSAGIEIPLQTGQPQVAPIADAIVALYTYDASAGAAANLTVSRVSGNLSIGVAVINQDTNAIVFLGGMPHTDSLSAQITFPADGTYAIGLFKLDVPNLTGTSGAVQVMIE